jgi:hypothetical protein
MANLYNFLRSDKEKMAHSNRSGIADHTVLYPNPLSRKPTGSLF